MIKDKKHPIICPYENCNERVSNESMLECLPDKTLLDKYWNYTFEWLVDA